MAYIGIQPSDINLSSLNIDDGSLQTVDFADGVITTPKLAAAAVTTAKLALTGVVAGNWTKVSVNPQGQITSGIVATTLSAYGITDAQPLNTSLTNILALNSTAGLLRKTGVSTWSLDTTTYLSSAGGQITGDLTMAGNIIPLTDVTYTLGTPSKMWKDLYVGPGSIYLNGKKILQDVSSTIVFSTTSGQNLQVATAGVGNLQLTTDAGGSLQVQTTLTLTSGKRIVDSAGINVEFGNAINMNGNKLINLATPTQPTDAVTKAYVDSGTSGDTTIVRTTGDQSIAGTKTFSGNMVISGNLTISGSTTTVNSQTILLADNILELNSDYTTGTPTEDSGFQVRRGDSGIVQFVWDETNKRFTMRDGVGVYLPLYTTSTITAGTFVGALTGNASSATMLQTARTINGATFDGTANISFTTDAVAEGTTNKYFTNARGAGAAPVQSVFGRTGTVTLTSADVTAALNYTPVNKAGDTMTGQLTSTQFNGPLVGNVTGNVSGTAGGETLATVTGRGATTASLLTVTTTAGGNFITAYKAGGTYSDGLGAFLAKVDNSNGAANYFYQGTTNGTTTFMVRADGLVTATAGFVGPLSGNVTGHASLDLALTGGTMSGMITSAASEALRLAQSSSFISGYNTANSVRTGYLQFVSGTGVQLAAEQSNGMTLSTTGGSLAISTTGNATFTGNVGVGNSPTRKLDVFGDAGIGVHPTTDNGVFTTAISSSTGIVLHDAFSAVAGAAIQWKSSTTAAAGTTEKMRLDPNGNLGIGTIPFAWSSDQKAIDIGVKGSVRSNSAGAALEYNTYYDGTNWRAKTADVGFNYVMSSAGGHQWFTSATAAAAGIHTPLARMTITSSGNVGVGTVTPDAPLQVVGTSGNGPVIHVSGTSTDPLGGAGIRLTNNSPTDAYVTLTSSTYTGIGGPSALALINVSASGPIAFATANVERMRIDSAGNVGIGTTAQIAKLVVAGGINSTHSTVLSTSSATTVQIAAASKMHAEYFIRAVGANIDQKITALVTSDQYGASTVSILSNYCYNGAIVIGNLRVVGDSGSNGTRYLVIDTLTTAALSLYFGAHGGTDTSLAPSLTPGGNIAATTFYPMVVDPSTNVGIGTTTPTAKLTVAGGVTASGDILPGATYSSVVSTSGVAANTYLTVIGTNILPMGAYHVTVRWDHVTSGAPYVVATAFTMMVVNTNGNGDDIVFTAPISTHRAIDGATLSMRTFAAAAATTGLKVALNYAGGDGNLRTYAYRFA